MDVERNNEIYLALAPFYAQLKEANDLLSTLNLKPQDKIYISQHIFNLHLDLERYCNKISKMNTCSIAKEYKNSSLLKTIQKLYDYILSIAQIDEREEIIFPINQLTIY